MPGWVRCLFPSQYASLCGTGCYFPSGLDQGTARRQTARPARGTAAVLATYDALFAYATRVGVKLNWEPEYTGDFLFSPERLRASAWHVRQRFITTPKFRYRNCIVPTVAAAAARWPIHHFSVLHEPCGATALVFTTGSASCFLSVSDTGALDGSAVAPPYARACRIPRCWSAPVRRLRDIGTAPYACPASGNYWCDWVTNLAGSLDYYAVHTYPAPGVSDVCERHAIRI